MTQEQLAERSGVTQPRISAIEQDDYTPTLDQLGALHTALGLPPGRLLRDAGLVEEDTTISPLLGKVERLSERDRRIIERTVDDMLGGD